MTELNNELRAKGIGSSEIAMLILDDDGNPLSRYGGPHKLWRIKTGVEDEDEEERPWLERGKILEPWIFDRYIKKTGAKLRRAPGTVQSPRWPVMVDSVDALAWLPGSGKVPDACVEAKAPLLFSEMRYECGEEGTDQIDRQILVQGQWHMGAWRLERCDYPIDLGTGDIKIYTSTHDEELLLALVEIAERFWRDHVVTGIPPPADASKATSEWLSRRLKQKDQDILDADEDAAKKLLHYRELRLNIKATLQECDKLGNEIKAIIGEHKGICIPEQPKAKVTFNEQKGRKSFNYNAYIKALLERLPEDVSPPDLRGFYKEGNPYRVFRVDGLLKAEI